MKLKALYFLPALAALTYAANNTSPAIGADNVVNAANYLGRGFSNAGIARGSLFLIFGSNLGPTTFASATFPLPGADGLQGTRIHISSGGYSGYAWMVYTSANQVAAIMPSDVPEGDATLMLNNNNLTSNPVVVRVVRSAFGIFTLNQAGSGPAVAQNYISDTSLPINTPVDAARTGQTVILWGTGLGPTSGDESASPLPGALTTLDALFVGGQKANVRYAGRSGCCAGLDQIVFDVPANVSGCYVPVSAITGGVVSNFGTIAVASSGQTCDDAATFRGSDLTTLQQTGQLRVAQVLLRHQTTVGLPMGSDTLSASFTSYTPLNLMSAVAPVVPPPGSCYVSQTPAGFDTGRLPHGDALNAGIQITASGPLTLNAPNVSPGSYLVNLTPADLPAGSYGISGLGGPDVGEFRGSVTVPSAVQWTNAGDYGPWAVPAGQSMTFRWTGGDPTGYISIDIDSSNVNYQTSIRCSANTSAGAFTIPDYITRTLVSGQGQISVGAWSAPVYFPATGLDAASVRASMYSVLPTTFVVVN